MAATLLYSSFVIKQNPFQARALKCWSVSLTLYRFSQIYGILFFLFYFVYSRLVVLVYFVYVDLQDVRSEIRLRPAISNKREIEKIFLKKGFCCKTVLKIHKFLCGIKFNTRMLKLRFKQFLLIHDSVIPVG